MRRRVRFAALLAFGTCAAACVAGVSATGGQTGPDAGDANEGGADSGPVSADAATDRGTSPATTDGSLDADAASADGAGDADACTPLDGGVIDPWYGDLAALCPPTWAETPASMKSWCTEPCHELACGALRTFAACHGWLQYDQYWGEEGPLFCMYDPVSGQLAGLGKVGGKSITQREVITCGFERADFNDLGCAGFACDSPDAW